LISKPTAISSTLGFFHVFIGVSSSGPGCCTKLDHMTVPAENGEETIICAHDALSAAGAEFYFGPILPSR